MLIEIIVALFLGMIFGTITGLTPGLHINLVAVILLSLSPSLLEYTSVYALATFIISMSFTHTFVDFIPSIFLGAPDSETVMAALPGHAMLLLGKGYEAVKLSALGCYLSLLALCTITPILILIVPLIFLSLQNYIGYLLLGIILFMLLREESLSKKFWAFFVFLLSGILGLLTFSLDISQPLFPLLSGLFGISTLLLSLSSSNQIPIQRVTEEILPRKREIIKACGSGIFSGGLLSIFPGLGPAQAAILSSQFYRHMKPHIYLIVVGGISSVSMMMSLITLYSIDKARNGSIVAVQELLPHFDSTLLFFSILIALISSSLALFLTLYLSKIASALLNKINYRLLSIGIIFFIASLCLLLCGPIGLIVLLTSTAIGLIPALLNVGRNHAMGVLLLPIVLYFLL